MKINFDLKLLSKILFGTLTVSQAFAQPIPPEGLKWEVVSELTDEFNDNFNTNKWYKELWDYQNTPTKMIAANSGVSNGNLWIKATLNNNSTTWFESSRIYSKAQIKFPMYTECSIKTAHISAYNTFWTNNGDINDRDEIDIIENNSKPSCGCQPNFPWQMNSQYFIAVDRNDDRAHGNYDNRNLSADNPLKGVEWNKAYHTVGMWWKDKNNVQFYLDGEPAGKIRSVRDFTRAQNLIWDLWTADQTWLGGEAIRNDLLNDNINTMRVDWVHTYKLIEDKTLSTTDITNTKTNTKIYPNPVSSILNIDLNTAINKALIEIYDNNGKLVKVQAIKNSETQVTVNDLSAGIYFSKVTNGASNSYQSFIKN